jgi:hypothetical protein
MIGGLFTADANCSIAHQATVMAALLLTAIEAFRLFFRQLLVNVRLYLYVATI